MRNFKDYIQEGIGKNTGRRDLSRHRRSQKPSEAAKHRDQPSHRSDAQMSTQRGILPHMMEANPQIHHLGEHIFSNFVSGQFSRSLHPEDAEYYDRHAKRSLAYAGVSGPHVGTITINNLFHPDDHLSRGGKYKHLKVHVIDDYSGSHNGSYSSVPHYNEQTGTIHTAMTISGSNLLRGMQNTAEDITEKKMTLKRILAHELAHGLQHAIGKEGLIHVTGSAQRGTDVVHIRHPDQKMVQQHYPTDWSSRRDANAPELTPQQRKTRAKKKKVAENNPFSMYLHGGHEGQARVMGKLPEIMDVVERHHRAADTYAQIKNSVNRIKHESENFRSPQAAHKFLHSNLSNLLDDHTKKFTEFFQKQDLKLPEDLFLHVNNDATAAPKVLQRRRKQLQAKQKKNIIALAHHVNGHYVNGIIHQHSGHNVLQTRENPEQLSHETQREIRVQEKSKKRSKKPQAPEATPVAPEAKPQEKKSLFKRFKSFVGLK